LSEHILMASIRFRIAILAKTAFDSFNSSPLRPTSGASIEFGDDRLRNEGLCGEKLRGGRLCDRGVWSEGLGVPATRIFILAGRHSQGRGGLFAISTKYSAGQDVDGGLTDAMGGTLFSGAHVDGVGKSGCEEVDFGCEVIAIAIDGSS
jgi:hypothetical protein